MRRQSQDALDRAFYIGNGYEPMKQEPPELEPEIYMKQIPIGWTKQPDGSYSKPASRKAKADVEITTPTNNYAPQFLSACESTGLPTPIPEYKFAAPERQYRADFAFLEARIIVEVDGGVWRQGGGAHSHPTNILRDMERTNEASIRGWRLMRFTPEELNKAQTFLMIKQAIAWKPA